MPNTASFKIFEFSVDWFIIKDMTADRDEEWQRVRNGGREEKFPCPP